jgi:hypothetical protein
MSGKFQKILEKKVQEGFIIGKHDYFLEGSKELDNVPNSFFLKGSRNF